MREVLIDTNILVDHLRGKPEATHFLISSITSQNKVLCSVITRIELMCGMKTSEESIINKLLQTFEEIEVTKKVAIVAGSYMNKYAKSYGINAADAIIAATAKYYNANLYTLNLKHFPMKDINVEAPY